MTAALVANAAAYSLQLGVVAAVAAGVTWAYPIRNPQRAHRFWQWLLVVAMALPLMALWQPGPTPDGPAMVIASASSSGETDGFVAQGLTLAAQVLAAGAVARLAWLIVGMAAVRRYVRRAVPVEVAPARGAAATASVPGLTVGLSADVRSPVTVGVVRPVVLLPVSWTDLDDESARAILLHETLHVQRRDWLRVCAEEAWCAVLWFHPGARLLVARLDTAREMLVDQHVVAALGDWRAYARTLMAFSDTAGPSPHPAASLIRPRHLQQRIQALSQEANMTRPERRWTAGVAIAIVAAVTAGTVWAMPMPGGGASAGPSAETAQDQVFDIGNGVTSPRVTREVKADYTKAALDAKVHGEVWLSVVVKKDGTVGDVQVRQSLDTEFGLDDAAVAAMRQWTFEPARRDGEPVAVRVTVEMRFTLRD
ncbi:M56 family metallopeptidase [Luteitalea sp.]|uniref:M56 family metallopeptidase n=1 Tax=Luteitalea sp. TaxID=2004800 RepID=UPI0025C23A49|nr:M56 family metallopeptidase [Luteitalea sp.]